MDLVQIREDILSRKASPLEKPQMFLIRGRALRLHKSQWQYFTHPGLPQEVEDAIVFLQLLPGAASFKLLDTTKSSACPLVCLQSACRRTAAAAQSHATKSTGICQRQVTGAATRFDLCLLLPYQGSTACLLCMIKFICIT